MSIDYIIKCDNLDEFILIQNRLFYNGYVWFTGGDKLLYNKDGEFPIIIYCYSDMEMLYNEFSRSEFRKIDISSGKFYNYRNIIRTSKLKRLKRVKNLN